MKYYAFIVFILTQISLYPQSNKDMVTKWSRNYQDLIKDLPIIHKSCIDDNQIKLITSEYEYFNKDEITKLEYSVHEIKDAILKNSLDPFKSQKLSEFQETITEFPNIFGINETCDLIDIIISNFPSDRDISFVPEKNVFINLYRKCYSKADFSRVNNTFKNYLESAINIYTLDWCSSLQLLLNHDDSLDIAKIEKHWKVNSKNNSEGLDYFFILKTIFPFKKIENINDELLKIKNVECQSSSEIDLYYQLSKNISLNNFMKNRVIEELQKLETKNLSFFDRVYFYSALRNLGSHIEFPSDIYYLFSAKNIADFLSEKKIITIPKVDIYLVEQKFGSSYFRYNESLLAWLYNFSNLGKYYAYPEDFIFVNDFYKNIYKEVFSALEIDNISYLRTKEMNGKNFYKFIFLRKDNILYESEFLEFTNSYEFSITIEYILNKIIEFNNIEKRIIPIKFQYPMYLILTFDNFVKLKNEYNLSIN